MVASQGKTLITIGPSPAQLFVDNYLSLVYSYPQEYTCHHTDHNRAGETITILSGD